MTRRALRRAADRRRHPAGSRVARRFDEELDQVAQVRRFARSVAAQWDVEADDLELVVDELASNAAVHAAGPYTVSLQRLPEAVLVEVADRSRLPLAVTEATPDAVSGRGLGIVDRLAITWGVGGHRTTKIVWAQLAASGTRTGRARRQQGGRRRAAGALCRRRP